MNDYNEISQWLRCIVLQVPKALQVLSVIEEEIGSEISVKTDNQQYCNSTVCPLLHSLNSRHSRHLKYSCLPAGRLGSINQLISRKEPPFIIIRDFSLYEKGYHHIFKQVLREIKEISIIQVGGCYKSTN